MADEKQLHILLVSLHLQGHLNPMLKFAKTLISRGIRVTLATTEVARYRMQKNNNNDFLNNAEIELAFVSDGLSVDFDRDGNLETFVNAIQTTALQNLSNLITELTKHKKFSCIIVNPFWPHVIDVAAEHNIPCAVLWIQACALYSIYYYYFKNPNSFPNLEDPDEIINLPGLPTLKVKDLPSFLIPPRPPIIKLVAEFFQRLDIIKFVLGTSFYELEEEIVKSMDLVAPIKPIGPLVSPFLLEKEDPVTLNVDMWNAEDSCIEWLDNQEPRSVIFIAFGSIILLTQKQMDNIAIGLKNSNKPFLWVVKPPEKGSEKEGASLPLGFLEYTKAKGLVVKWCPQEKVLKHKAIACFLTHCGWNSTLETVVTGVPAIGHPEWTDQPTNAKLIEEVFKVGLRMRNGEDGVVSAEEVERCIKEITDGPRAEDFKKRATELKIAANKALEDGGSSAKNLDQFIREIVADHDLSDGDCRNQNRST